MQKINPDNGCFLFLCGQGRVKGRVATGWDGDGVRSGCRAELLRACLIQGSANVDGQEDIEVTNVPDCGAIVVFFYNGRYNGWYKEASFTCVRQKAGEPKGRLS